MSTKKLRNIPLREVRSRLRDLGFSKKEGGRGGHEIWTKKGLTRPVVIQSHEDPVPEFILRNMLKNIGINKEEFFQS